MQSLRDKWILVDKGEHYLVGQVTDIEGDYILVRMRQLDNKCPWYFNMFHISELSCDCRECVNSLFFDDEDKLNAWIKFVDQENEIKNNVVSIDSGRDYD